MLRNSQNLASHLSEAQIEDQNGDCFGIQRRNLLDFFETDNTFFLSPPCIGHDFYEGVVPKFLSVLFEDLIKDHRFSANIYKERVKKLSLAGKDLHSVPSINFTSNKLRITMNESFHLLRFLPLILDGIFQISDPKFQLLLVLIEISSNISAFSFDVNDIAYLGTLISDFLRGCREHMPGLTVTIKFHHLVHYPRMIKLFGPLRFYSTMNFESHHSFLKSLMRSSKNWIYPAHTIAKKYARHAIALKDA